jgi:hypothetical protein
LSGRRITEVDESQVSSDPDEDQLDGGEETKIKINEAIVTDIDKDFKEVTDLEAEFQIE